jgi:S-adenosylmethionine hydrolase
MSDYKQTVTLTTDWMDKSYYISMLGDMNLPEIYLIGDHYVAQLKGCLRQLSPNIEIFDVCNTVQAFSVLQAGYILRTTYPFFPKGTVHLIGVNSEPTATNKILVVKHDGHYFAGADDGLYHIVFENIEPEFACEIVPEMLYKFIPDLIPKSFFDPALELNNPKRFSGFSAIKIFATVVNHIMNEREISLLGKPVTINREKSMIKPVNKTKNNITGNVIFIDHFGNIITNISRDMFDSVGKGRPFGITLRGSKKLAISAISTDYSVIGEGQNYLAIFNSSGVLEIARLNYNLARLEIIDVFSEVRIDFSEEGSGNLFF